MPQKFTSYVSLYSSLTRPDVPEELPTVKNVRSTDAAPDQAMGFKQHAYLKKTSQKEVNGRYPSHFVLHDEPPEPHQSILVSERLLQ